MRRLHRYKQVRSRAAELAALGLTPDQVDTNGDGEITDAELQAAVDEIERVRMAALAALGVVTNETSNS